MRGDHPHDDPGDGRTECDTCGKWIWPVTHSCKGVPVTLAALARAGLVTGHRVPPWVAGPGDYNLPRDGDADPGVPYCGQRWRGFGCTRLPDHRGTHRAGTSVEVVAEWWTP